MPSHVSLNAAIQNGTFPVTYSHVTLMYIVNVSSAISRKDLLTKITDHKRVSEEPALGPAFSYRSVIILNILSVQSQGIAKLHPAHTSCCCIYAIDIF